MSEKINVARLKREGENFEVVINPEQAVKFKKTGVWDDVLKFPQVFTNAKKGEVASETRLKAIFDTIDQEEIAKIIIQKGEVQITSEQRNVEQEQKRNRIISIIQTNGIDPKTGLPHPLTRIENAFEEAKVTIDERIKAEDQVQDILQKINPILPIKFVTKEIEIIIPAAEAGKAYGTIKQLGKILKEEWQNDGSLLAVIEIPGGLEEELTNKVNSATHGSAQITVIKQN